ncbi:MAG: site-specific integrase [Candidatus Bathyarchaeota archaeon]|nr:site-specific integrase [Candidatus Bathyarchaeota archaeon]
MLGPIPFKKACKKDMVRLIAKVKGADHTRSDFQKITKLFYAWLYDVEDPRHEGYPKAVSWLRPKQPKSTLKASDLLNPNDVKKLINATMDLRLKALIAVCYECGLRIGEALNLRIENVKLEEQCVSLTVSGKTGPRLAYAIESLPLLMQWLDQHPDRNNPEAWLWTDDSTPLTYDQARQKLSQTRKKAKIHK